MHDLPGTTRDAIDTVVETDEGPLRFVDTAGLRRKSQIDEPSEYYSLVRALEAIDRADAALFLIDASEGVTNQDQRLAERVDAAGNAVVLVLNKWDLLDAEQRAKVRDQVADKLGFIAYAPALPISALTGKRVHNLLPALARRGDLVSRARSDRRAQPCAPRRPGRPPASHGAPPPPARAVRDPGCERPADVHAVRDPFAVAAIPPLLGAEAARVVRPRADAGEAAGTGPQRVRQREYLPGGRNLSR